MILDNLLSATKSLHESTPELQEFSDWPTDLARVDKAAVAMPAISLLSDLPNASPLTKPIQDAAHLLEWRRTYSADEVGEDFLNRYGYVELFGPNGHFHSSQLRGYLAFWDHSLDYGWHHHEAEELYYSLQGTPLFQSKSKPEAMVPPGQTRHHGPWEIHGMKTLNSPYLCYAVWKGPGMADLPEMEL